MEIKDIPLDEIEDPTFQPRAGLEVQELEALASSIREIGLINPITVVRREDHYQLVSGTRRYHAVKMLGWAKIPAKEIEADERTLNLTQFSENFHRCDLNPIERAHQIKWLMDELGFASVEIARLVNRDRSWVSKQLILLEQEEWVQHAVADQVISPSVVLELRAIPDKSIKEQYIAYAMQGGCTESMARQWVKQAHATLAAKAARQDRGEEGHTPLLEPQPITEPPRACFICGAPAEKVILETFLLCFHCQQALKKT